MCAAFALYSQLEELVPAGLTPDAALRAVTPEVARFLRWSEVLSQGREEREAVLVLLEGNPLKEIRDTRRIVVVVLRGEEVLERLELDRLLEERRD